MRYFPEIGVGYVVLLPANSGPAMTAIRRLMFAYLARDRVLPPLPEVPGGEPAQLDADAFAFASPRHELLGFIDRVRLAWHLEVAPGRAELEGVLGGSSQYVPTPDGGFRHRLESGTSMRVARNVEGKAVLLAHGVYAEATWWWIAKLRIGALISAIVLLGIAPLYALGVVGAAALRRTPVPATGLVLWPAIAGLLFELLPQCLALARARGGLGVMHPWTIAVCALTLLFALASGASIAAAVRWSMRADRPPLRMRMLRTDAALCSLSIASISS